MIYVTAAAAAILLCLLALICIPQAFERVYEGWKKRLGDERRRAIASMAGGRADESVYRRELRMRLALPALLTGVCLIFILLAGLEERSRNVTHISRPNFGEGGRSVELVAVEGEKVLNISLQVGERTPTQEELDAFFEERYRVVTQRILGDNVSLDEVRTDLDLISGLSDGTKLTWQMRRGSLIGVTGTIDAEVGEEGAQESLGLTISYGGYYRDYTVNVRLLPPDKDYEKEALEAYINNEIEGSEQKNAALPSSFNDSELSFKRPGDSTYFVLALLAAVCALLMPLWRDRKADESYERRIHSLEADYPRIVSKLAILFHAGLGVPGAWEKLASDYEKSGEGGEGFSEALTTARVLRVNGYSEGVFDEFGRRCSLYAYRRLGTLLEQSIKKGTVELAGLMEKEAADAFELRKRTAARQGETAGSRLLIPTMLLFGLVIAMVVVPAWMGMKL